LINKVILEYAHSVGDLEEDVRMWADKIDKYAQDELSEFFPPKNGIYPSNYLCAYSIDCSVCSEKIPVSNRWWFNKRKNIAIRPRVTEGTIEYDRVEVPGDVSKDEFDPNEGTVQGGDVECPHCGSVTEREIVTELFQNDEFEYEICGVRYEKPIGGTEYHAASEGDREGFKKAQKKVSNDLQLATLLSNQRYIGRQDRAAPYGITSWRDIFSPRQLITHATYLNGFNEVKQDIQSQYETEKSEAILVLLSMIATKLVNRNSRLQPMNIHRGAPSSMLGNNNFAFQWHFGENNLLAGSYSYQASVDTVMDNYQELVDFLNSEVTPKPEVNQGDATDLPYDDESIEVVVIDPPYGDNVMYAELSDAFYVWLREYHSDTFSDAFSRQEVDKVDEAVENPSRFKNQNGKSATDLTREDYEGKMSEIFSEAYRVMKPGGVITIYFTDKETEAWDSLTMSLINSGFTVTATHTITSEMPQRIGMQERSSADSTLLLTCRKPPQSEIEEEDVPTLWSDIREQTRRAAKEKATELLDSGLNLTKTDTIISAYGPTLREFTESYPVVDKHDEEVRPKRALEEARTAVTEILVERELSASLDDVDSLTRWYILSWLVYDRSDIPYDEARQLGLGVGVQVDDVKRDTKIWGKSGDKLVLKGQDYRVQDYTELESGAKRRKRAYPVDPRNETFEYNIDGVHAALNVLETKGGDFTWNWLKDRDLHNSPWFIKTVKSLVQTLPEEYPDHKSLINLSSGETGKLLDINLEFVKSEVDNSGDKTTLQDF
jgi:adenine-specific DNA methylase